MYAIIRDGGRQYKVEVGQKILVDLREGVEEGGTITFTDVLALRDDEGLTIGRPTLDVTVTATVNGKESGPKLVVQKFRRRKTLRKRTGHRQKYISVTITDIKK